jgi:hypothetical protein
MAEYGAKPIDSIKQDVILIKINRLWEPSQRSCNSGNVAMANSGSNTDSFTGSVSGRSIYEIALTGKGTLLTNWSRALSAMTGSGKRESPD